MSTHDQKVPCPQPPGSRWTVTSIHSRHWKADPEQWPRIPPTPRCTRAQPGALPARPPPPAPLPASSAQGAPWWQREGSGSLRLETSQMFLTNSNTPFHEMDSGTNSQNFHSEESGRGNRLKTMTEQRPAGVKPRSVCRPGSVHTAPRFHAHPSHGIQPLPWPVPSTTGCKVLILLRTMKQESH